MIPQFPHCDSRVLHAPGECDYCDMHPEWQELREAWNIAFTGHDPEPRYEGDNPLPCPADYARPPGSPSDHRRWGGNKPTSARADEGWPEETFASIMLYGNAYLPVDSPEPEKVGPLRKIARELRTWWAVYGI
jgi:hypothetical protein